MTSKLFSAFLSIVFFCCISGNVLAASNEIPKPIGDIYVQDFANLLSKAEKQELNHIGRSLEEQTTAQVAILTVQTTEEKTIEEFANEAFRQYGIGNKQKNNGVLLVLATEDKKVRIEVGYGLEGRIPDGKAGRILDEYTLPYLKNQEPNKAITETYKVLVKEVYAEYGIDDQQLKAEKPAETNDFPMWLIIIIVIIVLFIDIKFFGGAFSYMILSILSRGGGRGGGGGGPQGGGGGSSGGGGASRGW
ncbi:TPM domain-containing protein [Niallia sp. 01092]|uniref:TPM domain-containing protein n=1 Tax=unclassified Niallia TaxID=2837522 RepID=UPI003FD59BAE